MASTSKSQRRSQRTSKKRSRTGIKNYQSQLLHSEISHTANDVLNMDDKYKDMQLTTTQVCICCLTEEYSNMREDCTWTVQRDVYEQMLSEIFNISIQEDIKLRLICEECVKKLHEALNFKRQIIESQKTLLEYILSLRDQPVTESNGIKTEIVKYETCNDNINDDHGEESYTTEDTMKYKKEEPQNNLEESVKSINILSTKDVEMDVASSSRKRIPNEDPSVVLKNCRDEPDKHDRERKMKRNTMKILKNTNVCPFRWQRNKYKCFCCKESYIDIKSLKSHMATHNYEQIKKKISSNNSILFHKVEVSSLTCRICSKQIQQYINLKTHLISQHNIIFDSEEDLFVPFKLEDGVQCAICGKNFTVFHTLNVHMNLHFQNHLCETCGQGFISESGLKEHVQRHKIKKYNCQKCNLTFTSAHQKESHSVAIHKTVVKRVCPHCPERFTGHYNRLLHLIKIHGYKKPEYKCGSCDRVFLRQFLVNSHIRKFHMKERNHECNVCGIKFFGKSDLSQHMTTHTGEKKHTCALCGKSYARKWTLTDHMKGHNS